MRKKVYNLPKDGGFVKAFSKSITKYLRTNEEHHDISDVCDHLCTEKGTLENKKKMSRIDSYVNVEEAKALLELTSDIEPFRALLEPLGYVIFEPMRVESETIAEAETLDAKTLETVSMVGNLALEVRNSIEDMIVESHEVEAIRKASRKLRRAAREIETLLDRDENEK